MSKPDCYKCKHRRNLIGDCHSRCVHPRGDKVSVKGNLHGIKNGWFFWPVNFDPVWLDYCDGFEQKTDK